MYPPLSADILTSAWGKEMGLEKASSKDWFTLKGLITERHF